MVAKRIRLIFMLALVGVLAACTGGATRGPGGADVYRISSNDAREIPGRVQDSVNTLRAAAGAPPVQLNAQLSAAARAHSRDMSSQNRPWWFGSDSSSPFDRARRAGYTGLLLGEVVSETFETEGETLAAWMDDPTTRPVLLDPRARDMGFGWYQENSGKIWWTLNKGTPFSAPPASASFGTSVAAFSQ